MHALRRRFATLRWRLMLSCFVAAFTAMMTLVVLFVLAPGIVSLNTPPRPAAMSQDLKPLAQRIAPLYSQTPSDKAQVRAALRAYKDPIVITEGLTDNIRGHVTLIPGENAALFALDANGRLLAALAPTTPAYRDLANAWQADGALAPVSAALHDARQTQSLVTVTASGQTVATTPVVDTHGRVVGALLIAADLAQLVRPIYLSNLLAIVPTAVLFALIASVFGAIFGILTARGLTRRLSHLTQAAGAWSHGDFSVTARDPSQDELGLLARDLNAMAERLQRLLRDQQRLAVVEERNRLARDLHDSVKQQLFALTMLVGGARLEVAEESGARRILDQAEEVAIGAQQEMTALIQSLRPVALTNRDLGVALRELCAEWEQRHGIACAIDMPEALDMEPSAEQELYRVVQEALANIAKHSGATRVEVRAVKGGETLTLRIRDNGHGFDVERSSGRGLGLSSMRERVAALGGTLRVASSASGAVVEANVPMSARMSVALEAGETPASPEPKEAGR